MDKESLASFLLHLGWGGIIGSIGGFILCIERPEALLAAFLIFLISLLVLLAGLWLAREVSVRFLIAYWAKKKLNSFRL